MRGVLRLSRKKGDIVKNLGTRLHAFDELSFTLALLAIPHYLTVYGSLTCLKMVFEVEHILWGGVSETSADFGSMSISAPVFTSWGIAEAYSPSNTSDQTRCIVGNVEMPESKLLDRQVNGPWFQNLFVYGVPNSYLYC